MWSIGVIMYIMLCGFLPFTGNTHDEVFKKIIKGKYRMDQPEWDQHSSHAKDLLKQLLTVNHLERITPEDALKHPWFESRDSINSVKTCDEN